MVRMLELAQAENAIWISPSYRLMPESNGTDIIKDVEDFWVWVHGCLPAEVSKKYPGLTVDLNRTAACGESAGGYLSVQSALIFHDKTNIKVVMAQYCGMHPDIPYYNPEPEVAKDEAAAVELAEANQYLTNYSANIKPGTIRRSDPFPALVEWQRAMQQTGRHRDFLGDDERLTLEYGLRTAMAVPPMWVIQGTDDTIVSIQIPPYKPIIMNLVSNLVFSDAQGSHGRDGTSNP